MWCVQRDIIKGLQAAQISAFSIFLCCGIGNKDSDLVLVRHTYGAKSKCEQALKRPLLSLRSAEEKECVNDSVEPVLDFRLSCWAAGQTWPGVLPHGPVLVFTTVCDADSEETGNVWDIWGSPDEVHLSFLIAFQNISVEENELRENERMQDWSGSLSQLDELRCSGRVICVWPRETATYPSATYIPFVF